MRERQTIVRYLMLGALLLFTLTGCTEAHNEQKQEKVFKFQGENVYLDEVWIYALTVRQGYEERYGNQIWSIEMQDESGDMKSLEEMTRKDVIRDICVTKVLVKQAESYGVSLSEEKQAEAKQQADAFYGNLTDAQLSETGITRDTVLRVFEENMLANAVHDAVDKKSGIEVSDEEARVTSIYDLYFSCYTKDAAGNIMPLDDEARTRQRENADAAYAELSEYLASDAAVALEGTENYLVELTAVYDKLAARYGLQYGGQRLMTTEELTTEYGEPLVTELYGLHNGENTGVVESEYGYHIIGMLALTEADSTKKRKDSMFKERQDNYFEELYDTWLEQADKKWSYEKNVNQEVYGRIPFGTEE